MQVAEAFSNLLRTSDAMLSEKCDVSIRIPTTGVNHEEASQDTLDLLKAYICQTRDSRNIIGGRVDTLQVAEKVGLIVTARQPKLNHSPSCKLESILQGPASEQQVAALCQVLVGHGRPQICHALIPGLPLHARHKLACHAWECLAAGDQAWTSHLSGRSCRRNFSRHHYQSQKPAKLYP